MIMEAKVYLRNSGIEDRVVNREDLPEYHKTISKLMEEYHEAKMKELQQDILVPHFNVGNVITDGYCSAEVIEESEIIHRTRVTYLHNGATDYVITKNYKLRSCLFKKEEVCVFIENEEQLEEAKNILIKSGEKIDVGIFFLSEEDDVADNFLRYDEDEKLWGLCYVITQTPITLSELETILMNQ